MFSTVMEIEKITIERQIFNLKRTICYIAFLSIFCLIFTGILISQLYNTRETCKNHISGFNFTPITIPIMNQNSNTENITSRVEVHPDFNSTTISTTERAHWNPT